MIGAALFLAYLVVAVALLAAAAVAMIPGAASVIVRQRLDRRIDELIRSNRARYRPGMERADLGRLELAGRSRWIEVERAQRFPGRRPLRNPQGGR